MTNQRDQHAGADQAPYTRRHQRGTSEAPTHLTKEDLRGVVAFLLGEYLGADDVGDVVGAEYARALYARAYRSLVVLYEREIYPRRSALCLAIWPPPRALVSSAG